MKAAFVPIYNKQNCGGTLSCTNSACKSIGCKLSKYAYCNNFGEGGVCPNLCKEWLMHDNERGEGYGYECLAWGRKRCTDEACPSTKQTAASFGIPVYSGQPTIPSPTPTPTPGPCTGKQCYNGFVPSKYAADNCACVCNALQQRCPTGYTLKIVGTVEPKKCQCVNSAGATAEPNPTSPPIGTVPGGGGGTGTGFLDDILGVVKEHPIEVSAGIIGFVILVKLLKS